MNKKIKLAVFASGGGSNAMAIQRYFQQHERIEVAAYLTNRPDSGVVKLAEAHHKALLIFTSKELNHTNKVLDFLQYHAIDLIILAGFLLKIPENLIVSFPDRIINIHPALLPKYGGKGMYGHFVHEAVKAAGDAESGMTIHLVNEHYDEGAILFQEKCMVHPEDTAAEIAAKVLILEHKNFAPIIEAYCFHKFT